MTRTAAIRALELHLETTASAIAFDTQSGIAQTLGKREAVLFGNFTQQYHVRLRLNLGVSVSLLCHQFGKALHADGETRRRGRFASELFDQPVIPSTGANRGLRTEPVRGPFEHGAGIVVETAYQVWIDRKFYSRLIEMFAKF